MIRVTAREEPRLYHLYVGDKQVGKIRAWSKTHVEAWIKDANMTSGWRFLRGEPTKRRALQAVLVAAGYGKASGFRLKERTSR